MSAPVADFSFSKKERLSNKNNIRELFKSGSLFVLKPLQFRYLEKEGIANHQLLISVPKRHHKTAVARNRLKRRIREAYRLNKQLLPEQPNYLIAIIYLSPREVDFNTIVKQLTGGLKRLQRERQEK